MTFAWLESSLGWRCHRGGTALTATVHSIMCSMCYENILPLLIKASASMPAERIEVDILVHV